MNTVGVFISTRNFKLLNNPSLHVWLAQTSCSNLLLGEGLWTAKSYLGTSLWGKSASLRDPSYATAYSNGHALPFSQRRGTVLLVGRRFPVTNHPPNCRIQDPTLPTDHKNSPQPVHLECADEDLRLWTAVWAPIQVRCVLPQFSQRCAARLFRAVSVLREVDSAELKRISLIHQNGASLHLITIDFVKAELITSLHLQQVLYTLFSVRWTSR